MAIKIIEEPTIHLTQSEYNRYMDQYRSSCMYYSGPPPSFEEYVRRQKNMVSKNLEDLMIKPGEPNDK